MARRRRPGRHIAYNEEKDLIEAVQAAYTKLCRCGWRIFNGHELCVVCEIKSSKAKRRLRIG